ncbi:MAG TPA: DUF1579 family protein [Thermoanaerobaculia bacterium]|nr:DUF1579 family protein [Thermoanaerobaculia bacterium]
MRHFKTAILVVSVLLTAALSVQAQEKKMEMPKPGPEVKKLGYFVGTWTSEGELKENPFGMPAGKMTSTDKCEWFTGGYSVICHTAGKGPMGAMHGIGIIGYSTEDKVYTYYGVDNSGYAGLSKGKIDGNSWVFTSDEKMGGKAFHGRYSMDTASPDSYTFKYETSEDGQKWTTVMQGKTTKAGGAEKKAPAEKK